VMSDIDLAEASGGIVFGFNVALSESVIAHAKQRGVEVRSYSVIYDLIDEVTAAMEGLLVPVTDKELVGEAEVRAVYGTGSTKIAGCFVNEGRLKKGSVVEVKRGAKLVYEGELTSLRRIKDSVKEVERGLECGLQVAAFNEWKAGDKITAYEMVVKTQTLEGVKERLTPEEAEAYA